MLGDASAATDVVHELDGLPPFAYKRPDQEVGRAWALAAGGDLPGARRVLHAAAEMARTSGYRMAEAALLHDLVRVGEPRSVVRRLAEVATSCEGELVVAYTAHAEAAARARADDLVAACDRFEQLGAALLAAEVAAEAADAFDRDGQRRQATNLRVRSSTLAAACEQARTPALAVPMTPVALTRRERDIATLAARGEPSRVIAERMFVSVRTINNHLYNIYSKLGVSGRRQLAEALADLEPPDNPQPPGR